MLILKKTTKPANQRIKMVRVDPKGVDPATVRFEFGDAGL